MRIATVLALCAIGAVAAFLLLRPSSDAPPLPPVAAVSFDSARLQAALTARAAELKQAQATDALGSGQLDELLAQDPIDLVVPTLTADGITATDVAVRRHGTEAAVEATVELAQLAKLSPVEVSDLKLDAESSRRSQIVVDGKAKALGFSVSVSVRVHATADGAVVAEPQGLPVGSTTLFSDPRVKVLGLRATPLPDGRVRVRATATVTG